MRFKRFKSLNATMSRVIDIASPQDLSKSRLSQPRATQGGSYVTRVALDGNLETETLIQFPACKTKQGIVTSGRKSYCDLMYPADDSDVLEWIEKVEKRCQALIHEKRESWFHNPLTEDDIESAFTSAIRLYRSGKFYLVRVLLKGKDIADIVFNQRQEIVPHSEVDSESTVIPMIKVDCIRFSSRAFALELSLEQLMVLEKTGGSRKCLITTEQRPLLAVEDVESDSLLPEESGSGGNVEGTDDAEGSDVPPASEAPETTVETHRASPEASEPLTEREASVSESAPQAAGEEPAPAQEPRDDLGLTAISLDELETSGDSVSLREPSEVYRQIYNSALEKARLAKKTAVEAYLEARRIRHTYLLDFVDDPAEEDGELETMES